MQLEDGKVHFRPHFSDGTIRIEHVQDCTPILDDNHEARREEQHSDWGRRVASVPNVILIKWLDEEWNRGNQILLFSAEFNALVERKLKDPDWAYLRTDKPKLQIGW